MSERQEKARAALAVVPQRGVCCHCSKTYPARATSKYCSAACMNKARRVLVSVTCVCGVVFQRRPSDLRPGEQACCSKRCSAAGAHGQDVGGILVRGKTQEDLARNVQVVAMTLAGVGRKQIAEHLKISINSVNSTISATGAKPEGGAFIVPWRPEEDQIIIANEHATAVVLSAMLPGRTPKAAQARRNLLGRQGVIAKRQRRPRPTPVPKRAFGPAKKTTRAPSHIVGAFEPTQPKPPSITCETVVPTSYDLPDLRHQCTYLYGRALPYRQCQAVAERGAWCAGHYAAVYRPDTAYERAA